MGDTPPQSGVYVRVGEIKGKVILRQIDAPLILCDLQGIRETGCRCIAYVPHNEWSDSEKWSALFRAGEFFEAEIACDPYIPLLCSAVQLRNCVALPKKMGFELGFAFVDLESDLQQILNDALVKINAEHRGSPKVASDWDSGEHKLGEILCRTSAIAPARVAESVSSASQSGMRLGTFLIREGVVTPRQVLEARSAQTGLAYAEFDVDSIPEELLQLFPLERLKRFNCVPIARNAETIRIACADPISKSELAAFEQLCGKRVELVLCPEGLPSKVLNLLELNLKRRTHQRFNVSMPASIRNRTAEGCFGDALPAKVIEISKGGMQVLCPAAPKLNPGALPPERLKLLVTVKAAQKEIVALCEVRHIRHTPNDSGGSDCVYGLKLDAIVDEHSELTREIMSRGVPARPEVEDEPAKANEQKALGS